MGQFSVTISSPEGAEPNNNQQTEQTLSEPLVNPAPILSICLKFLQDLLIVTYEFRGTSLYDAVQKAVGQDRPKLEQKKLQKTAAKFDFAARVRLGSALFVGEGNFSFALSMARLKGVTPSSLLATAYEAEADLSDMAYDNAAKLLKLGAQVKNSPFYEGAFKMNDVAKKADLPAPAIYTFNPEDYPGYAHQNTADEESAIDEHTAFATFVFST